MLLRFAFAELNMFRVSANVAEYNDGALALMKKFGFTEEVRRRQARNAKVAAGTCLFSAC
jgi:RimJ/RimL family protein N-acetyltransferase